jgi:hypothetical protein
MLHEISGKVLWHDLFLCPFVTHFGFCPSSSNLGPLSLFLLFPPLLGVLFIGVCQGFISMNYISL